MRRGLVLVGALASLVGCNKKAPPPCSDLPATAIGYVDVTVKNERAAPMLELLDHQGRCTTAESKIQTEIVGLNMSTGAMERVCLFEFATQPPLFLEATLTDRLTKDAKKTKLYDMHMEIYEAEGECLVGGRYRVGEVRFLVESNGITSRKTQSVNFE